MHDYLIDMLECPACHGALSWDIHARDGKRVERADATCQICGGSYPTRDGIGQFLTADLPRDDLWDLQGSWLTRHLREHPEIERQLMDGPLEALGPADQRFRATVLEERGQLDAARATRAAAAPIYTEAYLAASASQIEHVVERLAAATGPVVDLASGAGGLVEPMARELTRPLVATDFSPTILRRNRIRWEHFGLYDRVSLLAVDARQTPFRDGAVETMTSNVGLINITQPGPLLQELRRIVGGVLLSISHFYDENDAENGKVIREAGVESLVYRSRTMAAFAAAGWEVEVANAMTATARPTPHGTILDAGIDGLPVTETEMEFCVLVARAARNPGG